jgi:hypothetical protein
MSCLAHHKRFRSCFHAIINQLRAEQSISVDILRTVTRRCCTCQDDESTANEPSRIMLDEDYPLTGWQQLKERVNQFDADNTKLAVSLCRLENLIHTHRIRNSLPSVQSQVRSHRKRCTSRSTFTSSLSFDDEDNDMSSSSMTAERCSTDDTRSGLRRHRIINRSRSMSYSHSSSSSDFDCSAIKRKSNLTSDRKYQQQRGKHRPRISRSGTFIFLPYVFKNKHGRNKSDVLLTVAKDLHRQRFISSNGHLATIEKEYGASISMITSRTSQQISQELDNAKKGLSKMVIHDLDKFLAMSESHDGEWVLIRTRKMSKQTSAGNIQELLDDLMNRWETCLTINKRPHDEDSDECKSNKK